MIRMREELVDAAIHAYFSSPSDDHEDSMIAAVQAVVDTINNSENEQETDHAA